MELLIDNGSTCSIISSDVYQQLPSSDKNLLQPFETPVYDASSNRINCHGHTNIDVNIGGHLFTLSVIVCDIRQDGIIGQDFLLKYVANIDYKTGKITTQFNQIQCWIGSDKPFSCCVVVRRTTVVPANSAILLPVEVSGKDKLTKYGYVEPIPSEQSAALMLPGVLPIQNDMRVSFVNCSASQMIRM